MDQAVALRALPQFSSLHEVDVVAWMARGKASVEEIERLQGLDGHESAVALIESIGGLSVEGLSVREVIERKLMKRRDACPGPRWQALVAEAVMATQYAAEVDSDALEALRLAPPDKAHPWEIGSPGNVFKIEAGGVERRVLVEYMDGQPKEGLSEYESGRLDHYARRMEKAGVPADLRIAVWLDLEMPLGQDVSEAQVAALMDYAVTLAGQGIPGARVKTLVDKPSEALRQRRLAAGDQIWFESVLKGEVNVNQEISPNTVELVERLAWEASVLHTLADQVDKLAAQSAKKLKGLVDRYGPMVLARWHDHVGVETAFDLVSATKELEGQGHKDLFKSGSLDVAAMANRLVELGDDPERYRSASSEPDPRKIKRLLKDGMERHAVHEVVAHIDPSLLKEEQAGRVIKKALKMDETVLVDKQIQTPADNAVVDRPAGKSKAPSGALTFKT